jgi:hypothetical protein
MLVPMDCCSAHKHSFFQTRGRAPREIRTRKASGRTFERRGLKSRQKCFTRRTSSIVRASGLSQPIQSARLIRLWPIRFFSAKKAMFFGKNVTLFMEPEPSSPTSRTSLPFLILCHSFRLRACRGRMASLFTIKGEAGSRQGTSFQQP